MENNSNNNQQEKIYKLLSINSKYSITIVSKVVSITIALILLVDLIALIIVGTVNMNATIDMRGQLAPATLITLRSPLNSEIKKIFVKGGETFQKGQVLIQYDTLKLKDQIDKLENNLFIKKSNISIKKEAISFDVEQSELNIKKIEAQLLSVKTRLREKTIDFFTNANIDSFMVDYKKGTHTEMNIAFAQLISAESCLTNLRAKKDVLLLNSQQELRTLSLKVERIENEIKRQYELLKKTEILAPFDGIILTDYIGKLEGTVVEEGASLFEISQINNWKASLDVSEKDIHKISVGDSVKIEVNAMKLADEHELIPGKIISISAEPKERKFTQQPNSLYKVNILVNLSGSKEYSKKFKGEFNIKGEIIKDRDKIINILIKKIRSIF
jgi:multidrug efflux pump subunit AcrA (membrane-fusion protein)